MKISFSVRIYLAALILRLIPVLLTRSLGIGLDDMFQYDMLARSISSGHGFRWYAQDDLKLLAPYVKFDMSTAKGYDPQYGLYTSFRAPLYPTFLAVVYFLSGSGFSRFFAARMVQAIFLGAPLAPLTYWVSKHLSLFSTTLDKDGRKTERTAQVSAWIVTGYPMLLVYPLGLGTENLFFVLLLAAFLFLLKVVENPTGLNFLFTGVFLALTSLTRSVIFPFVVIVLLYLLYLHGKKALLAGSIFMALILPWVARNSLLHHKFTGIETSMGYNLYLGYHPQGDGSFVFGPSLDLLSIMDDAERDKVGTQAAIGFITVQPERFVPLALNRLGFFFGLEKRVLMYFYSNNLLGFISKPRLITFSTILLSPFVIISTSAAIGSSLLRWSRQTILLSVMFLLYLLPHIFILAEDRFHLTLVPYLAILAAYFWVTGLQGLADRWSESKHGKWAIILGMLVVVLLFLNWQIELVRDADKITALLGPNGNKTFFPY